MINHIRVWHVIILAWAGERAYNKNEVGASLVEYALLLGLIAVVSLAALTYLGVSASHTLNNVANAVNNP
jgi:Flp pilus assembly pilin Flp